MSEGWWVMPEAAVRAAILGLAAAAILVLRRRRSPATAHAVWVTVVLGMLALPLLTALAPRLALEVPAREASGASPSDSPTAAASKVPEEPAAAPVENDSARHRALELGAGLEESSAGVPWLGTLAGLYAVGSFLMLFSLLRGWSTILRMRRTARDLKAPALRALVAELGPAGRPVRIVSSRTVRVPQTAGFFRPCVFLPESWRGWSPDKLRAVLAHELSHVRRGDFLWILLAEINKCLYWFHPLAWIARRRLDTVAEEASDADALKHARSPAAYARALVEVAALLQDGKRRSAPRLVTVPMASPMELTHRVERILRPSAHREAPRRVRTAGSIGLALLVVLAGTLDLVAQPGPPGEGSGPMAEAEVEAPGIDGLIAALGHADPERRARAAFELAFDESHWPEAIPHLIALLGDDAPVDRLPRHLWRFSDGTRWVPAKRYWHRPSPGETAAITLAAMSSLAAEPLAGALGHGDPVTRRNAAWALGELRHPRGIPEEGITALVDTLDDLDASVREAVAWALGDIRVRRAIPELVEALRRDPVGGVRARAAHALGEIRAAEAEEALTESIRRDFHPGVQLAARAALSEVREHGY